MTSERDATRIVRAWLQEGVTDLPDRVLDAVLDQVPATHQESRWMSGWRNHHVQNWMKIAIAAAAVVVVGVAGFYLYPRSDSGVGGSPSASPSPSPSIAARPMTLTATSGVQAAVDVPLAWHGDGESDGQASGAVIRGETVPPDGLMVQLGAFANTYADPCLHTERTPPVGPTVDDLVTALADTPNMTATEPVQTTLGGRPATYIELTADAELPCEPNDFYLGVNEDGYYFFIDGPRQIIRIWVLDVDGTRVYAMALHFPEATAEALAEEQLILDSIRFESGGS